jgi:hypothetical protein
MFWTKGATAYSRERTRWARSCAWGKAAFNIAPPTADRFRRSIEEMPCHIQIALRNGQTFVKESRDYPGFVSQPMSWEMVCNKFNLLTAHYATEAERKALINAVADLENTRIQELMQLLARIRVSATAKHNRKCSTESEWADIVELSSQESFPASDSPPWNPPRAFQTR